MPQKRSDYARNARKHYSKRSGCLWCGVEGYGRIPAQSEYCSDVCLQADMEGIDEIPPVIPLAYSDPAYVARKWTEANARNEELRKMGK